MTGSSMQYRTLGKSGISVSEIGLGCSGFWGDKHFSEEAAHRVVHAAFEAGVNFFDTGSNYSNFNAEPRLGRAIAPIIAAGHRDRLVLSTKGGSTTGYAPTVPDDDQNSTGYNADAIEQSCLKSIENLGSGYIDIFQLHGVNYEGFNDELFDRLLSLKKRGLIRAIGVNTHFHDEMLMVAERPDVFDMVLIDCNLLQLDRYAVIQTLTDKGIGVVVGTVLAQGHLIRRKIGSIRNGSFFWYLARSIIKPTTRDFQKQGGGMRKVLAGITEMSPSQAAFAHLLSNPNICSCVLGTTSVGNLMEVVATSGKSLTQESQMKINRAFASAKSLSR
jgi:aryl-alcohol dehydrogenase-like predicted oxidoreductase